MKKIIFVFGASLIITTVCAQKPNTQNASVPVKVNKNIVQPAASANPSLTPPRTMTAATGTLIPEKDLAISDIKVAKDLSNGQYTVSCKISNVGTSDIDLMKITYFKCNNQDYDTPMYGMIIQCDIAYGTCAPNSACGYWPSLMLNVYNPDGTAMIPGIRDNSIKPGQTLNARSNATQIPAMQNCGNTLKVSLVLDPLNRVGDQNLANNRISATVSQ